ncbi:NAD(+)/NADH kinase [bacterium]|nr:NAD(+)/NADH kinase [bacterium]
MKLNKVTIAINTKKKESFLAQTSLLECFDKYDIKSVVIQIDFKKLKKFQKNLYKECKDSDLLIVIGGDGSILATIRPVVDADIPVLGINTGKVGFLTEFNYRKINEIVEDLINDKFRISNRQLLEVEVVLKDKSELFFALNDFILSRGIKVFKVINYEAKIDGSAAINFYGDGIVIATPTGSTAYNLSAGGPIMYPEGKGLMVTPICSHSLLIKPFIISDTQEIIIKSPEFENTIMSVDGHLGLNTSNIKMIKLKASKKTIKLIVRQKYNFFKVLFSKLK